MAALSKNMDVLVDALASEATAYAMDESTGPCLEYMVNLNYPWLPCRLLRINTDGTALAHKRYSV